jgi:hypothetical protein
MLHHLAPGARRFSLFAVLALILGLATPSLAAGIYILTTLTELTPAEKVKVAAPQPVQLITEFQTSGAANAKANKYVTPIVLEEVKASGVVGAISDTPAPNGARLGIVINDIPDKDAAKKGAAAGFTFGLVGVIAGDNYEVTLSYAPPGGGAPIVRKLEFRVFFKMGNKELPAGSEQVKNADVAVRRMIHLTVSHGLNQIAGDPAFAGAPASPAPAQ